ncbi:hypothetical protein JHK82_033687 [Glycine max]|nr:hypothetical protein JHK82_033687 [Glycine max]
MEERYVVNKPLMFKGANYNYCKEIMIAFFESTHIDMWDVIVDASTNKGEPTLDASSKDEDSQPEEIVNFDGEEAIFKSREDLIKGYSQLLFVFAHISKAYRKLNKRCSTS